MNNIDFTDDNQLLKLSDYIRNNVSDSCSYVWVYEEDRICLDGTFTVTDLKKVVSIMEGSGT